MSNPGQGGGQQTGQAPNQISGQNTGSDGSPTLGMTSIQKTQKSQSFQKIMALSAVGCAPTAVHEFTMTDGTIWITQAYLILDEIEFHLQGDFIEGIADGPFAIDLTATDPFVPEIIDHGIPPGQYIRTKFRFKQIDSTTPPSNLGDHLEEFKRNFLDDVTNRRPSILIKGVMQKTGSGDCLLFTLVTDLDWRVTIQFLPGKTVDPGNQDIIVLADLPTAFQSSGVTVSGLIDEIDGSKSPSDPLGGDFLDGRLGNPNKWGTPAAMAVAGQIPEHFHVFTQAAGTFEADPAVGVGAEPVSDSGSPEIGTTGFPES